MNTKQLKGSLYCILGAFIWGVAFVAQVAGMDHVGPFTFLCMRSWLAAVVLALVFSCLFTWVPVLNRISAGISIVICTVAAAAICAALFPIADEEVAS